MKSLRYVGDVHRVVFVLTLRGICSVTLRALLNGGDINLASLTRRCGL